MRINLLPSNRPTKPPIKPAKTKAAYTKPEKSKAVAADHELNNDLPLAGKKRSNVFLYVCGILFLLGALLFSMSEYFDYDLSKGSLLNLKAQVVEYRNSLVDRAVQPTPAPPIDNRQPELAMITQIYRPWSALFNGLTATLPKEVWLTAIDGANEGSMTVKGRSLNFIAIADYIKNLQANTLFSKIKLKEIKQVSADLPDYIFTLEIEAGGTALDSKK